MTTVTSVPRRLADIVALAEEHGWTYDETAKCYPRLTPPKGLREPGTGRLVAAITFSKTPGDQQADRRPISRLRRCGVPIPYKGKENR